MQMKQTLTLHPKTCMDTPKLLVARARCVMGMCERAAGTSPPGSSAKKPMRCCSRRAIVLRRITPCSSKGSALSYARRTSGVTGNAWCVQHRSVSTTCRTCAATGDSSIVRVG